MEEICFEKEKVESKMKSTLLVEWVGKIGCAASKERDGLIILDGLIIFLCLLRGTNEKEFSF